MRSLRASGESAPASLGHPGGRPWRDSNNPRRRTHMPLVAYHVALEVIRELRPLIPLIRKYDRELAKQLVDAANSTLQNLAEGERHTGGNKQAKYEIAQGEANEVKASLDAA